jgi:hypothetical protein
MDLQVFCCQTPLGSRFAYWYFVVKCLSEVLLFTNVAIHDNTRFFCRCTTASATSVQLHKAVSVCDHQSVFTTITD